MATSKEFIEFILDRFKFLPQINAKKMFGEYGLFYIGKMVAIIADDTFYLKPTDGAKKLLGEVEMSQPYTGAKPYFLITDLEDLIQNAQLIKITWDELPFPPSKKRK